MSKAILVIEKPATCADCPLDDNGKCILAKNCYLKLGQNCPLVEAIGYIQPVGNLVSWEDDTDVD